MALVVPTASEKTILDFALGVTTPGNQTLKLFVNDVTPDDNTTEASLTEMSTLGYAAKTLTKTSWVTSAGAVGQPATSAYAQQSWTFTAGAAVTVYGYYIVDSSTGKTVFSFKTLADTEVTDRVAMSFSSSKGSMKLTLSALDLTGIPAGEAHLGLEVTIGSRIYVTYVTFFETSPGKYGLAIP